MDAKKAWKAIPPRRLRDTKSFAFIQSVSVGLMVVGAFFTWLAFELHKIHPNNFLRNNPITEYLNSEENKLELARWRGLAPPSMELQLKYFKQSDTLSKPSVEEK